MVKMFLSYFKIGIINTVLHWLIFFCIYHFTEKQNISNSIAFILVTTFSFFINARYTFKENVSLYKYMLFVLIMFTLSWITGKTGDSMHLNPLITLVSFSIVSLILGFLFSKFIIFRKDERL